jgi:hypothetical protein
MLEFVDSFDHYAYADILNKWTTWQQDGPYGGGALQAGRNGNGLRLAQFGALGGGIKKTLGYQSTWIVGWAAFFTWTATHPTTRVYELDSFVFGAVPLVRVVINVDGTFTVTLRGGATLGTSTATAVKDRWYYYQVRTDLSASGTSTLVVRVRMRLTDDLGVETPIIDGTVDTGLAITGLNTDAPVANEHNFFAFGGTGASTYTIIDDVYILSGVAAADPANPNNDFLGDVEIGVVYADGDSAPLQLTPSAGATHFSLVNAVAPTGDASYVAGNVVGLIDLYTWQDVVQRQIHGVQMSGFARKDDAGSRAFSHLTRPTVAIFNGDQTLYMGNGYYYHRQVWDLNPATGLAWTPDQFNAARFGVEIEV